MMAAICACVGVVAGIAAALGVFARGDGTFVSVTSAVGEAYEIAVGGVYANSSRQLVAEGTGWDAFTLVVAAPILLLASIFVARGSFRGYLVAAGMLGYFLYMHLEYAVTWAFGPMLPSFIVVTGASVIGIIGMGTLIADAGVRGRFDERFPRRSYAALTIGMALLLTVMWIGRIADALNAQTAVLHGETTMTVQALDLGLVVPTSVLLGLATLWRHPAGTAAAAAFSVTFVAMSAAIAAMMVSASIVTGTLQLPPIILFGIAAFMGLALMTRIHASLGPTSDRSESAREPSPTRITTTGQGARAHT
ncbi:MAG TPA: hypothetical protein VFP30_00840 [Candidatus Limnocylindria bacterium]|nr:hypothetical protein [Candidatus Limnocylindria bacterium]